MRLPFKQGWQLAKQAVKAWSDDYAPSMGAALSYYTLFSIAPLLLIVISVAGFIFGDEAVRGELTGSLQALMGEEGAKAIEGLLASVERAEGGHHRHRDRHLRAAARCDHGVRRAAERARPHLARAGARGRERPVAPAALAPAVARHDPRHRVPADGLAGVRRGAAGRWARSGAPARWRRPRRRSTCWSASRSPPPSSR